MHRAGCFCDADGSLISWSLSGNKIQEFGEKTAILNDVDLSPDGTLLATVGRDFAVRVYNVDSGEMVSSATIGKKSLKSVCFATQDSLLIGNYWGGLIRYEVSSRKFSSTVIAKNGISALVRQQSGAIAAASYDGTIYLIHANTLEVVNTLKAMDQRVLETADA